MKKPGVRTFKISFHWKCLIQSDSFISAKTSASIALSPWNEILLVGDWKINPQKPISKLPLNFESRFVTMHNKSILVGGTLLGNLICLELNHDTWKQHSNLNDERLYPSVVTTEMATFVFGGKSPQNYSTGISYEYLPNGCTTWKVGTSQIPIWFEQGCAVAIPSDKYIWLFGSKCAMNRIVKFDIDTLTFQELSFGRNGCSRFKDKRYQQRCIAIPGTMNILITGGLTTGRTYKNTTEIFNTENLNIERGPSMNVSRAQHGIGIITIKGYDRIVVFGGIGNNEHCLDSVEVYNTEKQKWTLTNLKLKKANAFTGNICLKGKTISDLLG